MVGKGKEDPRSLVPKEIVEDMLQGDLMLDRLAARTEVGVGVGVVRGGWDRD